MRKLIDIPDNIVKDLKLAAAKDDKSFKAYLEKVIEQKAGEDLFYSVMHNETQMGRGVNKYLLDLYDRIKDDKFKFYEFEEDAEFNGGRKFDSLYEFLTGIIYGAELTIQFNCEKESDNYFSRFKEVKGSSFTE